LTHCGFVINGLLYFIEAKRFGNISVLASSEASASDPQLHNKTDTVRNFNPPWRELSYRRDAYEFEGRETFPATRAHHLAVFNSGDGGVTMREFEAFGYPVGKGGKLLTLCVYC
jgi:hypothetical protein